MASSPGRRLPRSAEHELRECMQLLVSCVDLLETGSNLPTAKIIRVAKEAIERADRVLARCRGCER